GRDRSKERAENGAFEKTANERRDQKSNRQAERKWYSETVDQDDGAIAAGHGKSAMGEIDEIHQSERDRQPAGQHEQQHAIGDTVIENGQHDRLQPRAYMTPSPRVRGERQPHGVLPDE